MFFEPIYLYPMFIMYAMPIISHLCCIIMLSICYDIKQGADSESMPGVSITQIGSPLIERLWHSFIFLKQHSYVTLSKEALYSTNSCLIESGISSSAGQINELMKADLPCPIGPITIKIFFRSLIYFYYFFINIIQKL